MTEFKRTRTNDILNALREQTFTWACSVDSELHGSVPRWPPWRHPAPFVFGVWRWSAECFLPQLRPQTASRFLRGRLLSPSEKGKLWGCGHLYGSELSRSLGQNIGLENLLPRVLEIFGQRIRLPALQWQTDTTPVTQSIYCEKNPVSLKVE